jgi:hypothetical protein
MSVQSTGGNSMNFFAIRTFLRIINHDERLMTAGMRSIIGFGFLIFGFVACEALPFLTDGKTAMATAASSPVVKKSKMHVNSSFEVFFVDAKGVQQSTQISTRGASYKINDQLLIRYVQGNPKRCMAEADFWYNSPTLLFVFVGVTILLFCIRDMIASYRDIGAKMRMQLGGSNTE